MSQLGGKPSALYAVAWKTACKLGLSSDKEAQEYLIFLKKLPYKIAKWKAEPGEEIKACNRRHFTGWFINELAVGSLKRWKKMFQENAVEAREKLIILLIAIREIVAVKPNKGKETLQGLFSSQKKPRCIILKIWSK